ncbi:MAG: aminoacyl-tRNA hydrolase [Alphaproteobacteria bacterium]|nr:aminoacyl-tRNA hydrolase [Alphaproteobacteria bacterium]MBR4806272.1 aminoacyl-tRNA hydrolase [Alphaproteobacteria bacterium]
MQENKPVLIVGLGNPGAEYERTRHNVGFMAIKYLAGEDATWKSELFSRTFTANVGGRRVIYAMPQTYMNDSGRAVRAIMDFYKIPIENIIVIHDDMDLKVGDLRTKVGGGSAGHNGIKSIDANVGNEYMRVRIGIDHPRNLGLPMDAADWVLGKFTNEQFEIIQDTIKKISF